MLTNIDQFIKNLDKATPYITNDLERKYTFKPKKALEKEIIKLEKHIQCSLPTEYRNFLKTIGHTAGPYYGLYSPSEIIEECSPQGCIFWSNANAYEAFPYNIEEQKETKGNYPCNGIIPICHHGCTYWTVLIISGKYMGNVLDVECGIGNNGTYYTPTVPKGIIYNRELRTQLPLPCSFLQWYSNWLQNCERNIKEKQHEFYSLPLWKRLIKKLFFKYPKYVN